MSNIPLTPKCAERLRNLRISKKKTVDEVLQGTKINPKTYERWEKGEVDSIRESNLIPVLDRLDLTLQQFLGAEEIQELDLDTPLFDSSPHAQATKSLDLGVCEEIDKSLISVLQSERVSQKNREVYKSLLYGGLIRRGFSIATFTKAIHTIERKNCQPAVVLDLASDLTKLKILIGQKQILTIKEPRLLWDCSCLPDDLSIVLRKRGYKPGRCSIHSHPRGNELMDLTSREFVELRFQGMSILWRQSRQLWPPSIDSVITLRNLQRAGVLGMGIESVLDLGCGTGVLGLGIARHNPSVRRIGFADWLLAPLLHTSINARHNLKSPALNWQTHLGMFDDWIADEPVQPFDLAVSTPPYLPNVNGFAAIQTESPVAGTELVNFLIENPIAKNVYATISSLMANDAQVHAKRHNVAMEPVGTPFAVPFRVPVALRTPTYITSLLESGRLEFDSKGRYPLWHRLMTFKLTKR